MYGGPGRWTAIPPRNERYEPATLATPTVIGLNRHLYVLLSTVLLPGAKKDVRMGAQEMYMRHT